MNTDGLNGAEQDWDSYQVTNEALRGRVGAKVPPGRPLLGFFLEGADHSHLTHSAAQYLRSQAQAELG
jgi:hypothetical protein